MSSSESARSDADRVAQFFDSYADRYDATYEDRICQAEDHRLLKTLRPMVRRAIRSGGKIADLGCGTGWMLDRIPELSGYPGWEGTDISRGMLTKLVAKHPWAVGQVSVADINDWTGGPDSYSLVASLYESPNFATSVPDLARRTIQALQPGGQFVFVPHGLGDELRVAYYGGDGHLGSVAWPERETIEAFLEAGAREVRVAGMRHPHMGPPETSSLFAHKMWLRIESKVFRPDAMVFLVVTGSK